MASGFELGQRVQYRAGGNWKPFGKIIEIQPPVVMTVGNRTSTLISAMYRVQWEADSEGDGSAEDTSGWLSEHNLQAA